MNTPVSSVNVVKVNGRNVENDSDLVVREEPLEIRLKYNDGGYFREQRLAVTMRTPGHDFELCIGFLISEGIIGSYTDVQKIFYCESVKSKEEEGNVIIVHLVEEKVLDHKVFNRNFYVSSSCGVCGKSSIESVNKLCKVSWDNNEPGIDPELIHRIPELARKGQQLFKHTGGLHASALFDSKGELLMIREDIGRHNALDKIIGARSIEEQDNSDCLIFVSGRAGFELIQKSMAGNIPVMIAVGAPSSLAVQLALDNNLTLIGFARNEKFNIYSGAQRVNPKK